MDATRVNAALAAIVGLRRVAASVVLAAVVASVTSLVTTQEPLFGLGEIVLPALLLAAAVLAATRSSRPRLAEIPARWRPWFVATTILPVLGVAGAVWLPEALIGYSDSASWSYLYGSEVSVLVLLGVAAYAVLFAHRHDLRLPATVAVGLLTLLLGVAGRDLAIARSDPLGGEPAWCKAEEVSRTADGGVEIVGGSGNCRVLLP